MLSDIGTARLQEQGSSVSANQQLVAVGAAGTGRNWHWGQAVSACHSVNPWLGTE